MRNGLSLHTEQKQVISMQMRQSLHILEMNVLELGEYLDRETMDNPVIDIGDADCRRMALSENEKVCPDRERMREWLMAADRQNHVYDEDEEEQENAIPDRASTEETLEEYLLAQILLKDYSAEKRRAMRFLIASLDEKGYCTEPVRDLVEALQMDEEIIRSAIAELQTLDPAGVGAVDLAECLVLQLRREKKPDELAVSIVMNHLDALARHHYAHICRETGESMEAVEAACAHIRRLNPIPSRGFSDRRRLSYIVPDVLIARMRDGFDILVNEYSYPRWKINSYYRRLSEESEDPEVRAYLRNKLNAAGRLSDALRQRTSTLALVSGELVKRQLTFFQHGPGCRVPLRLSELSEALSLHISTISRALSGKYFQCSFGIFPMTYLLTGTAGKPADIAVPDGWTADALQAGIGELIRGEDKHRPLSDGQIAERLAAQGIKISRRTVAKYRGLMGIADKSGRQASGL